MILEGYSFVACDIALIGMKVPIFWRYLLSPTACLSKKGRLCGKIGYCRGEELDSRLQC